MNRLLMLLLLLIPLSLSAGDSQELLRARDLVARTLKELSPVGDAVFGFTQTSRQLAHLRRPWNTWNRDFAGTFLVADDVSSFYQLDSTTSGRAVYSSYKYCCDSTLAVIDYGDTTPRALTLADKQDFIYDISVLTPLFLLKDFLAYSGDGAFVRYVKGDVDTVVYRKEEGNVVAIAINSTRGEVASASITYSSDIRWGRPPWRPFLGTGNGVGREREREWERVGTGADPNGATTLRVVTISTN